MAQSRFHADDRRLAIEAGCWGAALAVVPTPVMFPGLVFLSLWIGFLLRVRYVVRHQSRRSAGIVVSIVAGMALVALTAPLKVMDSTVRISPSKALTIPALVKQLEDQGFRVVLTREAPVATLSVDSSRMSLRRLQRELRAQRIGLQPTGYCGNATMWSILLGTRTDHPKWLELFVAER